MADTPSHPLRMVRTGAFSPTPRRRLLLAGAGLWTAAPQRGGETDCGIYSPCQAAKEA